MQGVIGHRGVDVMLNIRLDCCVRQRSSNCTFVAPKCRIDECQLRAAKQISDQIMVDTSVWMAPLGTQWRRSIVGGCLPVKVSLQHGDIWQGGDLRGDDAVEVP